MIFIKYICLILIFLISTSIGLIQAKKLKDRVKELSKIQSSLYLFITKIEYTNEPIKEIFSQISNNIYDNETNIFCNTLLELQNNNLVYSWDNSLNNNNNLKIEDIEILKTFGKSLGKLDKRGQIGQIQETINLIKKQIEIADLERQKSEKLYKSLGSLIGAIIIIILI